MTPGDYVMVGFFLFLLIFTFGVRTVDERYLPEIPFERFPWFYFFFGLIVFVISVVQAVKEKRRMSSKGKI